MQSLLTDEALSVPPHYAMEAASHTTHAGE